MTTTAKKGQTTQKGQTTVTTAGKGKGKNKTQIPAPVPAPEVSQETFQAMQQLKAFEGGIIPAIVDLLKKQFEVSEWETEDGEKIPFEKLILTYRGGQTKEEKAYRKEMELIYSDLSEIRRDKRKDNEEYAKLATQAQDMIIEYKQALAQAQGKKQDKVAETKAKREDSEKRRLELLQKQREQNARKTEAQAKRKAEKEAEKAYKAQRKLDGNSIAGWAEEVKLSREEAEKGLDAGEYIAVVVESSKEYFKLTDISRNFIYVYAYTHADGEERDFALPVRRDENGKEYILNEDTGKLFPFFFSKKSA